VDDLPDMRTTLSGLLSDEGYYVRSASSRAEALRALDAERFHVAILDVRLDESDEDNQDGLLLMHEIRKKYSTVAVIILTGYANVKMVQEALQPRREGPPPAFAFLQKSELDQLPEYVARALERPPVNAMPPVRDLIAQGENDRVEFKASIRSDFQTKAVVTAIAGMLNSNGGVLLIGVADDGKVVGIEKDLQSLPKRNIDGFQLRLTDIVRKYLGIECVTSIHARFERIDGKRICLVLIEKSPAPVFFVEGEGHKFWVRTANSTRSLDVKATMSYIQAHWGKPR
jgi:CheY-like chemotaxis protein